MKKKLSLTEKISLAENNAVDFMHACVTIALYDEYEVGCLPLAPAEVEKRIQTVLQAPAMPESWERRRAR